VVKEGDFPLPVGCDPSKRLKKRAVAEFQFQRTPHSSAHCGTGGYALRRHHNTALSTVDPSWKNMSSSPKKMGGQQEAKRQIYWLRKVGKRKRMKQSLRYPEEGSSSTNPWGGGETLWEKLPLGSQKSLMKFLVQREGGPGIPVKGVGQGIWCGLKSKTRR